jgi:hypothetical protein
MNTYHYSYDQHIQLLILFQTMQSKHKVQFLRNALQNFTILLYVGQWYSNSTTSFVFLLRKQTSGRTMRPLFIWIFFIRSIPESQNITIQKSYLWYSTSFLVLITLSTPMLKGNYTSSNHLISIQIFSYEK